MLEKNGFRTDDIRYTDKVEVCGSIRKSMLEELGEQLVSATASRVKLEIIEEKFDF